MSLLLRVCLGVLFVGVGLGTTYASSPLPLKNFIVAAEKNDPVLLKILSERQRLAFLVDQGLPSREILLEVEHERGFATDGESDTYSTSGTVTKEFIESGTEVSVTHTNTKRPDRKEDVTEFRLEQDLFKNIFGRDVRLQKEALKEEASLVNLEVIEAHEDYLNDALVAYLDFAKVRLDRKLADLALREAKRLRDNVSQKYQKKIASATDLEKGELQVLVREEDFLVKNREFLRKQERVEQISGLPADDLDTSQIHSYVEEYYKAHNKKSTFAELRAVKIDDLRKRIAAKNLTLAKRESQPELSMVAGYDIDNSRRFSSTVNRKESIIGLNFAIPFWDTQSSANAKAAVFAETQADLNAQITQNELRLKLQDLDSQIRELQAKRDLSRKKMQLSQRILQAEKQRYNYGKISLNDLITVESDSVRFQFEAQSQELEYSRALLGWLALNDQLLGLRDSL